MNRKIVLPVLAMIPLIIGGCASETRYQTPQDQIIGRGIDIRDFSTAAGDAVSDLLASGALDKTPNPPAVLFVSRIINNTSRQIDTDLLTQKITRALNQSGKAVTTSTDPAAKGYAQENAFMNDQQKQRLPDFTLSGKIIETNTRANGKTLTTYTFQLSLNDTRNAYQVWEGDKEIGKVSTGSPPVGW